MILILTSQKGATVSKDGHLKEFGDLHRSLGWYIQGENYNSAVARFQICAADSRITLLVTRGGLGLAHLRCPLLRARVPCFAGLGHPPRSVLSLTLLLCCRQDQPVSRKSLRGLAHLFSHLGTISFPQCRGLLFGGSAPCFGPVRSMCLPAGRSSFLSSRLCCWLLLWAQSSFHADLP